ncbi:hypothetical protein TKK_0011667 [Trichogramma kaykai]
MNLNDVQNWIENSDFVCAKSEAQNELSRRPTPEDLDEVMKHLYDVFVKMNPLKAKKHETQFIDIDVSKPSELVYVLSDDLAPAIKSNRFIKFPRFVVQIDVTNIFAYNLQVYHPPRCHNSLNRTSKSIVLNTILILIPKDMEYVWNYPSLEFPLVKKILEASTIDSPHHIIELKNSITDNTRFLPGTLLLISNDHFNTMVHGIVLRASKSQLREGMIHAKLFLKNDISTFIHSSELQMLECKLYFNHLYTLSVLKNMSAHTSIAMIDVILQRIQQKLPEYLNEVKFLKLNEVKVPYPELDGFRDSYIDDSQKNAIKYALTNQFSIIKGPPGTGKTYTATKIVSILLDNKSTCRNMGPIIVVSFTNQSLDNFLEKILDISSSIIRLGSRSQSAVIKKMMLKKKRNLVDYDIYEKYIESEKIMKQYSKQYATVLSDINFLNLSNSIVSIDILKRYCDDEELSKLTSQRSC